MKTAVCVGVSNDLTFAAVTTLLNFRELHGDESFSYILFSDKFSKRTRRAMQKLSLEVKLQVFSPRVRGMRLHGSKAIGQFSPLVLSKLEAFNLAKDFQCVIWLDYDIVILQRLDELFSDPSFDFGHMSTGTDTATSFVRIPAGHETGTEGVSAGLLVVRNSLDASDQIYEKCWELFRKEFDNLILPEQGLMEICLPGFSFRTRVLPGEKYSAHPGSQSSSASIIHCWGPVKFWSGRYEPIWDRYYRQWLQAGGAPFSALKNKLARTTRKIRWAILQPVIAGHKAVQNNRTNSTN